MSFPVLIKKLSQPRYRGRHIVAIGGKIYSTRTGKQSLDLLEKLERQFPKAIPTLTYVPKSGSLILMLR